MGTGIARLGFALALALAQIFGALGLRAQRESTQEVAAALEQIAMITRRRLGALFSAQVTRS